MTVLKQFLFIFVAALGLILNQESKANNLEPIMYEGVDITPAVIYFSKQVKTLNKPVTVYHWDNSDRGMQGSSALVEAKELSLIFWKRYGNPNGSMYGDGLYAAVDPVSSHSYGSSSTWSLMQMKFPKGFRLLDLALPPIPPSKIANELSSELQTIAREFDCFSLENIDHLFVAGGTNLSRRCQSLVQYIFKNIINIDGFAYRYNQSYFNDCESQYGIYSNRAFVVTGKKWIESDSIRFFNKDSFHNLEERIQIQTLFLTTNTNNGAPNLTEESKNNLKSYFLTHPKSVLKGTRTICEGKTCQIFVSMCEVNKECEDISLGFYPRPGGAIITMEEALSSPNRRIGGLLWADLEGKPKSKTTSVWLKENIFNCTGPSPYEEAPTTTSAQP